MAWRWLVLGEVLVVVLSMLSVSTGGGRHKFDANDRAFVGDNPSAVRSLGVCIL